MLAGIVGVDLPMDIRDLFYDVTNFKLTKEHVAQTILDAVALLPVVAGIHITGIIILLLLLIITSWDILSRK